LVGFSTTNLSRALGPTLSWNLLRSLIRSRVNDGLPQRSETLAVCVSPRFWCKPLKGASIGRVKSRFTAVIHRRCEKKDPTRNCEENTERRNRKGRDIGYAPAASSCEGANNVDTCTVTALDVITAFAVPNPNFSSQSQSVFSGLVAPQVALLSRSPSLLWTGEFY
jgi:hypothetical protein